MVQGALQKEKASPFLHHAEINSDFKAVVFSCSIPVLKESTVSGQALSILF